MSEQKLKKQMATTNIKAPNKNLAILKKHFSNCFTKSGGFDVEKLKTELSTDEIDFYKESYGMDWLGKSYARLLAADEATTLLTADEEFNAQDNNKNSENLLIKGDNLEVLKHLSNAYSEKVKMIYIDPPYNTGSDNFVYQDDRKFTVSELQSLIGIDEDKAKRILDFTASKSNSHSAWLTFMYPRLYVAKQLLRDDGVIFISIDDNEVAQLKMICDEVFGEDNFIDIFSIRSNPRGNQAKKFTASQHEFIICYAKNSNSFNPIGFYKNINEFKHRDEGGEYREIGLRKRGAGSLKEEAINQWYPIYYNVNTKKISITRLSNDDIKILPKLSNGKDGRWRWSFKNVESKCSSLLVREVRRKSGEYEYDIFEKDYYSNDKKTKIKSLIDEKYANYENATEYLKLLFNELKVFDYPKPVELIKHFLLGCLGSNDLILDFFAGSGTTADAVMQLNAENAGGGGDNSNRKFILVQLPEPINPKENKTAYDFVKDKLGKDPTIFEITKERLIRAAKKIHKDNVDKPASSKKDLSNIDLGFKVFETTPIPKNYNFNADKLDSQTKLFDESKLTKDDIKALLTTWKTFDGIPLTQDLQKIDLDGYIADYADGKLYFTNKGFTTANLKILLEKIDNDKKFHPISIIAFGYYFESKNLREIAENIKSYANKKHIDIDFIIRY